MADITAVNPWRWQDNFGFAQAIEVSGGQRVLYCAGQASVDGEGNPVHAGDMEGQVTQAMDNLETVLTQAGLGLENVVRLIYYTTDVEALIGAVGVVAERLGKAGRAPASTLLGVQRLFHPDLLVELEATAVA